MFTLFILLHVCEPKDICLPFLTCLGTFVSSGMYNSTAHHFDNIDVRSTPAEFIHQRPGPASLTCALLPSIHFNTDSPSYAVEHPPPTPYPSRTWPYPNLFLSETRGNLSLVGIFFVLLAIGSGVRVCSLGVGVAV